METSQITSQNSLLISENSQDFNFFARPMTSRLLEAMELSQSYTSGLGDYLFYEENGKTKRALDLAGGYGANLLGHRNPRLLNSIRHWLEAGTPAHTQASIRKSSGILARRLSETLQAETKEGPWITTFSNSGTEAVEAAIKHCLLAYQHRMTEIDQEITKQINLAVIKLESVLPEHKSLIVNSLKSELLENIDALRMDPVRKSYLLHQVATVHELQDLIDVVRSVNELQMSLRPKFIALEKAFHGKTMGSLALTYNEGFRSSFYLDDANNENTLFISQYIDPIELDSLIEDAQLDLLYLSVTSIGVIWTKQAISTIAAAFVEPIQGEAGVIPVTDSFLAQIKKHSIKEGFLLVFDEIQSGMYRTGKLAAASHTNITADIYTFSKSLGGGFAKIAATTIHKNKYKEEFGFLHTSTMSDDDFSSNVALEVLDILQGSDSPLSEGMSVAQNLRDKLEELRTLYPDVVKFIRGKGLLLAIEFYDLLETMGLEFKTICDSKMQGYMMASALLNHESVRMSPSLSNGLTLRIAPSIYFTNDQVDEFLAALEKLCIALKNRDNAYFLSALYPGEEIPAKKTPELITEYTPGNRPLAVFLCHLIDDAHIKRISPALRSLPSAKLVEKISKTKDVAEFKIYHVQTLTDKTGKEIDIIMLGIAVTSEDLKKSFMSKNKYKIVSKVQSAVDFAHSLGANTVGLGQFTSIVSGNGLYLNPRGMNLTTGNSFTIALAVQSALRSAQEKQIDLPKATAVMIGAAGNIMSVATSLMADHVGKIIAFHHTPVDASFKFQEALKRILADIIKTEKQSPLIDTVKRFWTPKSDLLSFLAIPEVAAVLKTSCDVNDIKEPEVVLCGASASNGFLSLEHFKENAIIVDVAVPPTIKPELLSKLHSERPDLTYHLGGVAQIPSGDSIDFFVFPLGHNECYACMAETFSLGFNGAGNFLNIGDLNKRVVLNVQDLADKAGFTLGSYKSKSSL